MPDRRSAPEDVVAVLVAHDGAAWLPRTLAALAAQTVRPRAVVGVDTGSRDAGAALLEAACTCVLQLPRSTGYPAAVHRGVAAAPPSRWLWLLHDDAAPAPDALQALLAHAAADPSAVLLGCKALDWDDPRVLVEVGLTVDAAGHRELGLERGEHDQGQHDAPRGVLAVGTAGALVRRDVWEAVGGLDPALPLLRDDVDLGWSVNAAGGRVVVVPQAVVAHARASTRGTRTAGALQGRAPEAVDRLHALLVRLAHAPGALLPLLLVGVVVAGLARAVALLLARQPGAARDELAAVGGVLARPAALARGQRRRARSRQVPGSALRPLFASRRARLASRAQAAGDWVTGGAAAPVGLATEPVADELPPPLDPVLRRPGVLLALGLLVVAGLAERALLPGTGRALSGGGLLPAPRGAADLWSAWAADGGAPVLAPLALLAGLLLGRAPAAVDVVVLLSVPLAGVSAYLSSARLLRSTTVRVWAAACWALLPVATGAVAGGHLGTASAQVLLPPLLLLGVRLLGRAPARDGGRHAWRAGLLLALVSAGTPLLWPLLVGLLLLAVVGARTTGQTLPGQTGSRLRAALVVAAVPALLLLPAWPQLLTTPGLLLHGPWPTPPGLAEPVGGALALLHPGGPGLPPLLLTLGLLLAALGAPVRRDTRRTAVLGWLVALACLLVAGVLVRLQADGARGWPGPALQVAGAGVLVAAAVAGDGLRARLRRSAFGSRQVVAAGTAVLAALTPLLLGGAWVVRGADGPLTRDAAPALPAFARAELAAAPGVRALVLQARPGGAAGWTLSGGEGTRLGHQPLADPALAGLVAELVTPRGSAAADALSVRAVRYVALRPAASGAVDLAPVLDAQPGLLRRASGATALWEVAAPTARLQVLPPPAARVARGQAAAPGPDAREPVTAPLGPDAALRRAAPAVPVDRVLPAGPAGRLLLLAEPAGRGWSASLDGVDLPRVRAWGWAQAFVLPPDGGRLRVAHDDDGRLLALLVQGLALVVVLVLAAPPSRRRRGLEAAP